MILRCGRVAAPLARSARRARTSGPRFGTRAPKAARGFSSTSGSNAATSNSSGLAPLTGLAKELDGIAPRFEIDADDVRVLREPREFYEVLKDKILNAKRRIYLATLYIGKTEDELISTIRQALRKNPELHVSILTDYFRGSREAPKPCCASLLAPLVEEFGAHRVEIRMWHTPNLTGLKERLLPKRINEGWGLQHMKLYACDDELILSGANLSNDYFTNRQDRYHVFKSREITDFYEKIYRATAKVSYDVQPAPASENGFELSWPKDAPCPSPQEDPAAYVKYASGLFAPLIKPAAPSPAPPNFSKAVIYPLFQLAPITKTSTELPALNLLLSSLSQPTFYPSRWTFTAGYFNMTPGIRDLLLKSVRPTPDAQAQPHGTLITAHPHANGFWQSPGVSGMLPPAYTYLASRFLRAVHAQGLQDSVSLLEWKRGECGQPEGWTYHAKGLWISLASSADPVITLVGSSNYTARSHTLDLEANALILTENEDLRGRLGQEERGLRDARYAKEVGLDEYARTERRVSWRVRVAMGIVRLVGGAL